MFNRAITKWYLRYIWMEMIEGRERNLSKERSRKERIFLLSVHYFICCGNQKLSKKKFGWRQDSNLPPQTREKFFALHLPLGHKIDLKNTHLKTLFVISSNWKCCFQKNLYKLHIYKMARIESKKPKVSKCFLLRGKAYLDRQKKWSKNIRKMRFKKYCKLSWWLNENWYLYSDTGNSQQWPLNTHKTRSLA